MSKRSLAAALLLAASPATALCTLPDGARAQSPVEVAPQAPARGTTGYVADALESSPSGTRRHGRLSVRGTASRLDYMDLGLPVVEIELPEQGLRRLLFPAALTYMEFTRTQVFNGKRIPCVATGYQNCALKGAEKIGGVDAEIWEIAVQDSGEPIRLWWDPSRGMTVREEYPGGRRMHAVHREHEPYEGFVSEQWEFTYLLPGGRYMGGMAVLVPELDTPVIERRPDGTIRRLVNIKSGAVDTALFEVPQGFRRIDLPHPPPPGQTAPSGWHPMNIPAAPEGTGPFAARTLPPSSPGDTAAR
ncbi:MAG: hypothetical protein KDJ18_01655 [Hyphomicrobiaceae bacterium]|nr:hypothetical protein [Hyphomicrobiaceae bacterium]